MSSEIEEQVLKAVKGVESRDRKEFNALTSTLTDSKLCEEDLANYILALKKAIPYITKEHDILIGVIFNIDWAIINGGVSEIFIEFLADLISAKTFYLKVCIKSLLKNFIPKQGEIAGEDLVKMQKKFDHIHVALQTIASLAPLASKFISDIIVNLFPYIGKSLFVLETYIVNILQVSTYVTSARFQIMALIVDKLMAVDVRIPRADLEETEELQFEGDISIENNVTTDNILKLDQLLVIVLTYINSLCHVDGKLERERAYSFFKELLLIYDGVMLKTQGSSHVQFILFYAASFHKSFYELFMDTCWEILQNPNYAVIIRQATAGYLASFLARAKYVDKNVIKMQLKKFSEWIHRYIDFQDGNNICADFSKHGPFYSTCQALFYVFVYHYKYLLEAPDGIEFIKSLNFIRIVTSKLNPLKYCVNTVVNMFARITRMYEIVFCYSVIERNNRNVLKELAFGTNVTLNQIQMFFPFDPYMLPKSGKLINPLYSEWKGSIDDDSDTDNEDVETSDIISDLSLEKQVVPSTSFDMMCISPGFQLLHHEL